MTSVAIAFALACAGLALACWGLPAGGLFSVAAALAAAAAGVSHPVFAAAVALACGAAWQCGRLWGSRRPRWVSLCGAAAGCIGLARGGEWAWILPMALTFTACYVWARREASEKPLTELKVAGAGAMMAACGATFGVIGSILVKGVFG